MKTRMMLLLAAVLSLAACASRGQKAPQQAATEAFPAAYVGDTAASIADYRIGTSDLIAVKVFQLSELDRDVRVTNGGMITLPLIGEVSAAGRTVPQLQQEIEARYRARYLQNPQVTVFLKEFSSQRVTVDGAVKKSGIYPIASRLSLLQAIAMAEGLGEYANEHNVIVFRTAADGQRLVARFDLAQIRAGEAPDPEIVAQDVVVVDRSRSEVWLKRFSVVAPLLNTWVYWMRR